MIFVTVKIMMIIAVMLRRIRIEIIIMYITILVTTKMLMIIIAEILRRIRIMIIIKIMY